MMFIWFVTIGCTEDKDTAGDEVIPMLVGEIFPNTPTPSGESVSGEFFGYHAFSFLVNDKFVTYISSNPAATCSNVVEYLTLGGAPYDPVDVLEPGACNMYIEVEGFENGSYSASNDVLASAASSISCAMGEGAFELSTFDADDRDYYWTADDGGPAAWWQGFPNVFDWDFSSTPDGYELNISMTQYSGSFIYEEFANNPASGSVSGTVSSTSCEDLASTGVF